MSGVDPLESRRSIRETINIRWQRLLGTMNISAEDAARVLAVSTGSLVVVVVPSYLLLLGAIGVGARFTGDPGGIAAIATGIFSALVALVVASAAVDVQFHGFEGLRSGTPGSLARVAACWLVVAAAVVVAVDLAVTTIANGVVTGRTPLSLAIALATLAAVAFALRRTALAFWAGTQNS